MEEELNSSIAASEAVDLTIPLIDTHGQDRGTLGRAKLTPGDRNS